MEALEIENWDLAFETSKVLGLRFVFHGRCCGQEIIVRPTEVFADGSFVAGGIAFCLGEPKRCKGLPENLRERVVRAMQRTYAILLTNWEVVNIRNIHINGLVPGDQYRTYIHLDGFDKKGGIFFSGGKVYLLEKTKENAERLKAVHRYFAPAAP